LLGLRLLQVLLVPRCWVLLLLLLWDKWRLTSSRLLPLLLLLRRLLVHGHWHLLLLLLLLWCKPRLFSSRLLPLLLLLRLLMHGR
jgi:hypothetical protein